jgi:hypothetical protein
LSSKCGDKSEREDIVRTRQIEQTALMTFLFAACVTLFFAAFAAHWQNAGPLRHDSPAFPAHRRA